MHVAYMHFNNRGGDGCNGIANSNRGMRITAGVDDNAVVVKTYALQLVYQLSLNIALVVLKCY